MKHMGPGHWIILAVFTLLIALWVAVETMWIEPFYLNLIEHMPPWLIRLWMVL